MRILMFSPRPPWPATRGGNQRSNLLYRALSTLGDVDLYLVQNEPLAAAQEEVLRLQFRMVGQRGLPPRGQRGMWANFSSLHPRLINRLAHNFGDHRVHYTPVPSIRAEVEALCRDAAYDLIVGRYLMPTAAAGGLAMSAPAIVDVDDVETQAYVSRLQRPGVGVLEGRMLRWHIARYERVIPKVAAKAAHLWVAATADLGSIPHSSVSVLPNIPFVDSPGEREFAPSTKPGVILSVTSMNFAVNERAIDRFVAHVWPRIRAQEPHAQYVVVGSQMTDAQRDRWSAVAGVRALGFVEDLSSAYRDASFTVVPIFEGGGTKIKVLESFLFGRVPVVTSHSVRGYEDVLKDGECLSVADTEEQLVQKCVELLRHPAKRDAMAARGAKVVAKQFSYERFSERVTGDVKMVLERTRSNADAVGK
jgi:hypothetical protein